MRHKRKDLEDRVKKLQRRVSELLESNKIYKPPVPIEKLAKKCGAKLRYEPYSGEIAGLLFNQDGQVVIGVNSLQSETYQRFTIAHEIGHLLLHDLTGIYLDRNFQSFTVERSAPKIVSIIENEANLFAAELLIPSKMFAHDIKGHIVDFAEDKFLKTLAEKYKVNLQTILFRLINFGFDQTTLQLRAGLE